MKEKVERKSLENTQSTEPAALISKRADQIISVPYNKSIEFI